MFINFGTEWTFKRFPCDSMSELHRHNRIRYIWLISRHHTHILTVRRVDLRLLNANTKDEENFVTNTNRPIHFRIKMWWVENATVPIESKIQVSTFRWFAALSLYCMPNTHYAECRCLFCAVSFHTNALYKDQSQHFLREQNMHRLLYACFVHKQQRNVYFWTNTTAPPRSKQYFPKMHNTMK